MNIKINKLFIIVLMLSSFIPLNTKTVISLDVIGEKLDYEGIQSHINGTRMLEIIKIIASDEYGGRYLGSEGDKLTQEYITKILKNLELEPFGLNDTYEQEIVSYRTANLLAGLSTTFDNSTIIISAHHDHLGKTSSDVYNGANDNASGVSVVLEVATILNELAKIFQIKKNILFAFWGAEERGFIGSKQFLTDKVAENANLSINLVINLDEVGYDAGDHTLWVSGGLDIPENYSTKFETSAEESRIDKINLYHSNGGSDHQPFLDNDIPAICLVWTAHRPYWHSIYDTAEKINADLLEKTTHIVLDFLINQLNIFDLKDIFNGTTTNEKTNTSMTNTGIEFFLSSIAFLAILYNYKRKKRN